MRRIIGLLGVSVLAAGCGDDGASRECGEGTIEMDGVCIVDPNGGGGGCAEGEIIFGEECVDPTGDFTDSKDNEAPASVTLGAVGETVTVSGCFEPDENVDGEVEADFDTFTFTVPADSVLNISGIGYGGAVFGYGLFNEGLPGYSRFGVTTSSTSYARNQFTPASADVYILEVSDSRSLIFGDVVGPDGACYYAEIEVLAAPTDSTALAGTETSGIDTLKVYSIPATPANQLTLLSGDTTSNSSAAAFTLIDENGDYFDSAGEAAYFVPGGTGALTVYAEALFNFDSAAHDFSITAEQQELAVQSVCPSQGGTGTVITMIGSDDGQGGMSDPDDEGISGAITLPFNYSHFGSNKTQFIITSNGLITFDTAFNASSFSPPTALPDATAEVTDFIAPFWGDFITPEICVLDDGTTVTIEWRGEEFSFFGGGAPAIFQLELTATTATAKFDLGHESSNGLVGHQNAAGDMGVSSTATVLPNSTIDITSL